MIDVGAMDSHNLEHQECDVRIKLYSHRLQQQWSNIQNPSKMVKGKKLLWKQKLTKNYHTPESENSFIRSQNHSYLKKCWQGATNMLDDISRENSSSRENLKSFRATSTLGLGLSTEEPLIGIDCLFPSSNYRWRLLRPLADMFLGNMYSICHFLYFIKFFAIRAEITISKS